MSGYGAVSQKDPEEGGSGGAGHNATFVPGFCIDFVQGSIDDEHTARRVKDETLTTYDGATLEFKVAPESFRFIAYIFFWFMCFFAITMSKLFVVPYLEAGPSPSDSTCPPFEHDFGGGRRGFNFNNETHLHRTFGFGNVRCCICVVLAMPACCISIDENLSNNNRLLSLLYH